MPVNEPAEPPLHAPGLINCAAYGGGVRRQTVPIDRLGEALREPDQFLWIGLFEPDAPLLRHVQRELGLHDLAIEDALNAHQRPKLELYHDSLFVVLRTAHHDAARHALEFGETHAFVGPNYIVTVRHGSLRSHVGVRARCESTPQLLVKGPGFVLYSVMDFVVDQYFPIVEAMAGELQELEEAIFGGELSSASTGRVYRLRRDLLALKRAVSPLMDVCNRLMRFETDLMPADTRVYFRDVYDHVIRINEMIDSQRELLTAALEANLALMSISQSEHMKRLAAWAAIIAVPTMIAGIYGMNFAHMPELRWQYGYEAALVVMAAACGALFYGFRRSGWL